MKGRMIVLKGVEGSRMRAGGASAVPIDARVRATCGFASLARPVNAIDAVHIRIVRRGHTSLGAARRAECVDRACVKTSLALLGPLVAASVASLTGCFGADESARLRGTGR